MTGDERVYAEWVEARSFGCKQCGYTSTNRRVVEQHLRLSHPDLFEGVPAVAAATTAASPPGIAVSANGVAHAEASALAPVEEAGQRSGLDANGTAAADGLAGRNVTLYTDAGTWDNGTKRQRSVFAVWDSRSGGIVVHEDLPGTTNNEAEYAGIISALELARNDGLHGVLIRSDSQLCVKQIKGEYQVKEERLRPLRDRSARLLRELQGRIEWVPRGVNHAGIFLEKKYKK